MAGDCSPPERGQAPRNYRVPARSRDFTRKAPPSSGNITDFVDYAERSAKAADTGVANVSDIQMPHRDVVRHEFKSGGQV